MLLAKLFIKDYQNTGNPAVRAAYGKLAGLAGIVCNVLLCTGKSFAGMLSGSVSITADALNNLSDAASGIISLIGFKLAEKRADAEHPYGHARYEYLAGFLVSVIIMLIGGELLKSSIEKIINPTEVEFGIIPCVVLAASIIVKLLMMLFYGKIARLISSDTLRASAADSRNDVISTSAVLAAAIISQCTPLQLDGVMGALVAVFILFSGFGLVRDTMSPLLGKAPEQKLVDDIHSKIMAHEGVLGTHDLMIHDYGPGCTFSSVHVEVSADKTIVEGHEIADSIEREFDEAGLHLTVHIDPVEPYDSETGEAHRRLDEIVTGIDPNMSVHDVRLVQCGDYVRCLFDCVIPVGSGLSESKVKEEIERFLAVSHPNFRCSITFDRSYAPTRGKSEKK